MYSKHRLVKLINNVISESIEHGGDAGGSYFSCPDRQYQAVLDLAKYLELDVYSTDWSEQEKLPCSTYLIDRKFYNF